MKFLIFGGTTEGRILAETLAQKKIFSTVCVATEYGEQVMMSSEYIEVRQGRMTQSAMAELIETGGYTAVIDATHPFAAAVSENIRSSVGTVQTVPLIRWQRPVKTAETLKETTADDTELVEYFDTPAQCADALLRTEGRVLLTTGSKDLATFCADETLRKRLMVRVLPAQESLKLCYDAGLEGKQILAMQGPFSQKLNEAQITEYGITVLVTKESGKTGGLDAKVLAARNQHIRTFIIRPPESSKSLDTSCSARYHTAKGLTEVLSLLGLSSDSSSSPVPSIHHQISRITLVGIGMGNLEYLTMAAHTAISQADVLFGAPRMLESVSPLSTAPTNPSYLAKDILPALTNLLTTTSSPIHAVILFSGDTGFYSGAGTLYSQLQEMLQHLPQIPPVEISVLPGISSIQYLSAKTGISWQDATIISAHGIPESQWKPKLEKALSHQEKVFFLTSGVDNVREIAGTATCYDILLGYQLSYPDEQILALKPGTAMPDLNPSGLWCGFLIPSQNKKVLQ